MRALTALEIEAMMVRHEAAIRLRKNGTLGPWEALSFVLMPTEDVLRASNTVAEESGPRVEAKQLAVKPIKRKPYGPRRWKSDSRQLAARA